MARVGKDKQPRKHTGKLRKEAIVDELTQKLDASSGVVFADYQGLNSKQVEAIKDQLRDSSATFAVTKNTLLKISLSKSQFADVAKDLSLEQPTATLFMAEDTISPLKVLSKAFKDFNLPKIKFGIIENKPMDEAGILTLASLPPREVLLSQFVGMLNSPIQGLVVTLNGTLQKLVIVLDQVAKAKPADAAPTPAPATEPATSEPAADQPLAEPSESTPEESPTEQTSETQPAEDNQTKTEGGDLNG